MLDRQIGWFRTFENAPSIEANLTARIAEAAAIANQTTGLGVLTIWENRGQRMAGRQRRELFAASGEEGSVGD